MEEPSPPLRHEPLARPRPRPSALDWVREWVRWFGIGRLIGGVVAVVVVIGAGYWLLQAPPTPVESQLPMATAGPTVAATSESSSRPSADTAAVASPLTVVVHVAGAVEAPGVYTLSAEARVADAIASAGGTTPDADLEPVNLAGRLTDGTRVYIPRVGADVPDVVTPSGGVPATGSDAPARGSPVDLNRATVAELDALPGVGPSTALAIIEHRESVGPFASVEDLLDVRGIGPSKLEAIRDLVTV